MRNVCRFVARSLIASLFALGLCAQPARAYVNVEVGFFSELEPYGDWVELEGYGHCWTPHTRVGWRPYYDGRWVFTDYGWTWVADEDWGWAPFHYGRWLPDERYGWVWVPGYEWAPAWVSWRYGDGWVGWAPLPPQARFRPGVGLDLGGVNLDVVLQPRAYTFVEERYFVDAPIPRHAVPLARNTTLVEVTRNSTNYVVEGRNIVNRGIPVTEVERFTRRPVPRYQVRDADPKEGRRAQVRGHDVALFRPVVTKAAEARDRSAVAERRGGRPESPEVLERRQATDRRELEKRQAADRKELERSHQREARTPRGESREEAQKRHELERRTQSEQAQRERQLLERRHEQERRAQGAGPGAEERLRAQERRQNRSKEQARAQQEVRDRRQQAEAERQARAKEQAEARRQDQSRREADRRQQVEARREAESRQAEARQQAEQRQRAEERQRAQLSEQARAQKEAHAQQESRSRQQAEAERQARAREQAQAKQQAVASQGRSAQEQAKAKQRAKKEQEQKEKEKKAPEKQ